MFQKLTAGGPACGAVSFVEERERIFGRWLSEVEQLVGHGLDRDAAFDAWANGYSATEYAGFIELGIH